MLVLVLVLMRIGAGVLALAVLVSALVLCGGAKLGGAWGRCWLGRCRCRCWRRC